MTSPSTENRVCHHRCMCQSGIARRVHLIELGMHQPEFIIWEQPGLGKGVLASNSALMIGVLAAGIVSTGVPQLPLTTLNSVVAVCQLSADLFPAKPVRPVLVSVSVGLMNMVGAWFGTMPCCHGAGGLAAQVCSSGIIRTAPTKDRPGQSG